jgi:hypothetical protein
MIFYDDPRTKLQLDYLEVYEIGGDLLLVSWIDRFGVCQVAIDRALLNKNEPAVDGIFVLITAALRYKIRNGVIARSAMAPKYESLAALRML